MAWLIGLLTEQGVFPVHGKPKGVMLNAVKYLFCGIVLSQYAFGDMAANPLSSDMLSEVTQCFERKKSPEELITGWKWGQIKRAFMFKTQDMMGNQGNLNYILAACPAGARTKGFLCFELFPHVSVYDLDDQDTPYLMLGLQRSHTSKQFSLVFMSCAKSSVLYPDILKFFKLEEPSCEDVKKKQPSQYWETVAHHRDAVDEVNHIDDQFIRWREFNPELDWVFRFNQGKCTGVMLRRREPSFSSGVPISPEETVGHLDLRELTDKLLWISDYQIRQFQNESQERLANRKTDPKTNTDNEHWDRRRLDAFNHFMEKYKANRVYVQKLGLQSVGVVKTPLSERFGAPWPEFSYFVSKKYGLILRSKAFSGGFIDRERVESFVLRTDGMAGDENVLLPHGLDIKPYLNEYPTTGVLYEHVRTDKRARIIVQPYIAYLYCDKKLVMVLVCNNKDGPVDRGWSLQRGYYCYEGMPEYYWPVSRGYCPLDVR